jgi:hypothetical protein
MFQFVYIYCTKTAFEPFACIDKEDGKSYMRFEPKIRCGEGHHLWLAPMGMVFGCLYGIGIPLIFTYIVYRNRKIIKYDQVLRVLGTGSRRDENPEYYEFRKRFYKLYYRFKPRYHYWGQVILLRKFLVVLCTVFLKANPTLQATCALMILFVSYSVHIRSMPYLRNDLLGADDADMEKATQNDSEKTRISSRIGNMASSGSLASVFGDRRNEGEEQCSDDEGERSASTVRERALILINKNPKSMSVSRSLRKTKQRVSQVGIQIGSQLSKTVSRHSMGSPEKNQKKSMSSRHSMSRMTFKESSDEDAVKCAELVSSPRSKSAALPPSSPILLPRLGSISELKGGGGDREISPLQIPRQEHLPADSDAPSYWEEDANGHYKEVTGDSHASSTGAKKNSRLESLLRTRGGAGLQASGGEGSSASSLQAGERSNPLWDRNGGGGGGGNEGAQHMKRHSSMYGVSSDPEVVGDAARSSGDGEENGSSSSMATNIKISKNFLMDYNTMETIFHFCSILILLCALMFESGSQGDLSGTKAAKTAKRNEAPAAAGAAENDGAEHYLLVVFVISVVALSSIYFMFALLSEVIRSFSHFARVMKQRKEGKKATKAKEAQGQFEMTQRCVLTGRTCMNI